MIKRFIFDEKEDVYTKEIEEITLDDFIKKSVMRTYNWKINYIYKASLQEYCDENNIAYKDDFEKIDLINTILNSITQEQKTKFCDAFGIGITKYNYLAAGMTEKEYNRIYKKLEVVCRETIKGKRYKNLYSVKQYINYIESGEIK